MTRSVAVRLAAKEAALVELLKERPMSLAELRELPIVRRKIGRGYLDAILLALISEGVLAITSGVFWVRISAKPRKCRNVPSVKPCGGDMVAASAPDSWVCVKCGFREARA